MTVTLFVCCSPSWISTDSCNHAELKATRWSLWHNQSSRRARRKLRVLRRTSLALVKDQHVSMSMSVSQREQVSPWLGSAGYRMAQKNFFSLKGFSDAGTGESRGSSLAWASQYDVRSAAALETWCGTHHIHSVDLNSKIIWVLFTLIDMASSPLFCLYWPPSWAAQPVCEPGQC